ncbi:UNVERIFIED_CONTAM: hypothetical protein RKD43_001968 [Streptomyces graminofaciens]
MTARHVPTLRRLLTACGRDFDPAVLMAYTPLHVYSNRP